MRKLLVLQALLLLTLPVSVGVFVLGATAIEAGPPFHCN